MRPRWISIFLLGTFVFWASGTAKFAHEQIEHHGHDAASADDDDDDDDALPAPPPPASTPAGPAHPRDSHPHHPCPICQMLAAMTVDRSPPPALPQTPAGCVAVLPVMDWAAPHLLAPFSLPARGPPPAI